MQGIRKAAAHYLKTIAISGTCRMTLVLTLHRKKNNAPGWRVSQNNNDNCSDWHNSSPSADVEEQRTTVKRRRWRRERRWLRPTDTRLSVTGNEGCTIDVTFADVCLVTSNHIISRGQYRKRMLPSRYSTLNSDASEDLEWEEASGAKYYCKTARKTLRCHKKKREALAVTARTSQEEKEK